MSEIQRIGLRNGQVYTYIGKPRAQVHQLRAKVRELRERGYIAQDYRLAEIDGYVVAEVTALRPLPKPIPLRYVVAGWSAVALSTVLGVGWLLWQSRYVLMAIAFAILAVWAGARIATGHQPTCVGLHCAGCRG